MSNEKEPTKEETPMITEEKVQEEQPSVLLSAKDIFGMDDITSEKVIVPAWNNGFVYIRTLSGRERDVIEEDMLKRRDAKGNFSKSGGMKVQLLAMTLVNEDNTLMFTSPQIGALNEKNGKVISDLYIAASKLNGFSEDAVEDEVKN